MRPTGNGQQALYVSQSAVGIGKESALNGKLDVSGSVGISGNSNIQGDLSVDKNVIVTGNSNIIGNSGIRGNLNVSGNSDISGNTKISGDLIVYVLAALQGDIGHVKENMGVYRRHQNGVTSSETHKNRFYFLSNRYRMWRELKKYAFPKGKDDFDKLLAIFRNDLINLFLLHKQAKNKSMISLGNQAIYSQLGLIFYLKLRYSVKIKLVKKILHNF
jgi:hypothetical protein